MKHHQVSELCDAGACVLGTLQYKNKKKHPVLLVLDRLSKPSVCGSPPPSPLWLCSKASVLVSYLKNLLISALCHLAPPVLVNKGNKKKKSKGILCSDDNFCTVLNFLQLYKEYIPFVITLKCMKVGSSFLCFCYFMFAKFH